MNVSKVGRGGQITLPRTLRRWLNLQQGDRVAFVRRGHEVLLQPLTTALLDLHGSLPVSRPQDFAAIRERVIEEQVRSVARDDA